MLLGESQPKFLYEVAHLRIALHHVLDYLAWRPKFGSRPRLFYFDIDGYHVVVEPLAQEFYNFGLPRFYEFHLPHVFDLYFIKSVVDSCRQCRAHGVHYYFLGRMLFYIVVPCSKHLVGSECRQPALRCRRACGGCCGVWRPGRLLRLVYHYSRWHVGRFGRCNGSVCHFGFGC